MLKIIRLFSRFLSTYTSFVVIGCAVIADNRDELKARIGFGKASHVLYDGVVLRGRHVEAELEVANLHVLAVVILLDFYVVDGGFHEDRVLLFASIVEHDRVRALDKVSSSQEEGIGQSVRTVKVNLETARDKRIAV